MYIKLYRQSLNLFLISLKLNNLLYSIDNNLEHKLNKMNQNQAPFKEKSNSIFVQNKASLGCISATAPLGKYGPSRKL